MNSKPIIWVTILILLFSSIIPISSSVEDTSYRTISINSESVNYGSIQEPIDNANIGDTIYISSGVYYEHIVVEKSLTIIGDGVKSTFVDGMGLNDHVFNILSDFVEITIFPLFFMI